MIYTLAVTNKSLLRKFIDFPHSLYKDDENYVPELFIAQRDILTPGKHPFHEHSEVKMFLVYENTRLRGRVAAILNNNHNQFNNAKDGFFGFFDCIDDSEIVSCLFDAAITWLKSKGASTIIGPVNPSTNDTCGILIDGFDSPPVAMMTYNKPYYSGLLESIGFSKKTDLLAYYLDSKTVYLRAVQLQETLLKRLSQKKIIIRRINMKDYDNEVINLRAVYNAAWDKNMGFVPMTDKEFKYLAKDLKMILDPEFCLIAEQDSKIVGFALAIPDINQILKKIKRGRLLPTGIFKLLFGRKKINQLRILALGVIEGYKKIGIEACFYAAIISKAKEKNIAGGEASWILEHNHLMNKGIQSINGHVYKKYRIYGKEI
ncbi:MAG: hypothetical protein WDO19_04350 [Bacteroidota bacterium]